MRDERSNSGGDPSAAEYGSDEPSRIARSAVGREIVRKSEDTSSVDPSCYYADRASDYSSTEAVEHS